MVLLEDAVYRETKKIALGEVQQSLLLAELSDWFTKTYSVKILNFEFTKFKVPNSNRHRLYVVIQNTDDYRKMHNHTGQPNENYQKQIGFEFQSLALKFGFAKEEQLKDLLVLYNDFSEEAKTDTNWKAKKEFTDYITKTYPSVWDVISMFSGSVVFYFSDSDISACENNGVSEKIKSDYYAILKKYDELNYFTRENIRLKFDSKENVDKISEEVCLVTPDSVQGAKRPTKRVSDAGDSAQMLKQFSGAELVP